MILSFLRLSGIFSIIIFSSVFATAQDSLSKESLLLLDSSFSRLDMSRSDFWMPWDAVSDDAHRLPIVKEIFGKPLKAFDYTKRFSTELRRNPHDFFRTIFPVMKFGAYQTQTYRNEISPAKLDSLLGIKLDSVARFVDGIVLRQYISAMVVVAKEIEKTRSGMDKNDFSTIIRHADSLLLMSEEGQNSSVFELKRSEFESDQTARTFFSACERTNAGFIPIFQHGASLYEYLHEFVNISRKVQKVYRDSLKTKVFTTKFGKIALGGAGNDRYEGDYFLIFDCGGNDTYILPSLTKEEAMKKPVRCIVDLDGDDTYIGGDFTLGGACFGISMLFDCGGNDTYSAGNFSLGSGLFGFGVVEDFGGSDFYAGKTNTQGCGAFGVGLLIDHAGNDSYKCQAQAQGFGWTRGFGALADFDGNDFYITQSPFQDFLRYDSHFVTFTQGASLGFRPIASGGIGMLFDYAGSDSYSTDIYGQGTAYWFGLGTLYDAGGDDRYTAYQYAQGAGIHFAHGILWDENGNDHYFSHGVSQGCGHDVGFGALIDEKGDDDYTAESLSLGAGNANALSLFLDNSGDDAYIARNASNTMGFSDFRRDYGMIGIFADGGGKDLYAEATRNSTVSTKSTYGLFADFDLVKPSAETSAEPALTPPDSLKTPLAASLDSLWAQATAAPQKFQYNVNPARDKMLAKSGDVLYFLSKKLSSVFPRDRLAMEYLLPKLYEKDSLKVTQLVLDSLKSSSETTLGLMSWLAGKKKIQAALPVLRLLLDDNSWRIRAMAAKQIGEIGEKMYADALKPLLADMHPHVQMRAGFALGQLAPDSLAETLTPALNSDIQLVRSNTAQGLLRMKDSVSLKAMLAIQDSVKKIGIKRLLEPMMARVQQNEKTQAEFSTVFYQSSPSARKIVYDYAVEKKSEFWLKLLEKSRKNEPDETLQSLLPKPEKKKKKKKSDEEKSE